MTCKQINDLLCVHIINSNFSVFSTNLFTISIKY